MEMEHFLEKGILSPALVADTLRTTKSEISATLGLAQDAFYRTERVKAKKTQVRLREMLEILDRANHFTGSLLASYAWYRSEPLTGYGDHTPDRLVREGHADYVHSHFDRVQDGGYA